jgi:hypothetical protein
LGREERTLFNLFCYWEALKEQGLRKKRKEVPKEKERKKERLEKEEQYICR